VAVKADLDALREVTGELSANADGPLAWALEAATRHVRRLVKTDSFAEADVQQAVLMLAHRVYKRRTSATGVEGFTPEGFQVRITDQDPDIDMLLQPNLDMTKAGIG
jgi:hypothetical protein